MSSIDRNINIDVNNREANQQLDRTSRSLSNVDRETRTVSASNRVMTEEVTKNGGAMALLNTVTGGLAQQFKDGYEAASLMTGGLKGLRGAIIATGIGALAVGLGLVVANFDKIKSFLMGSDGFSQLEIQTAENTRSTRLLDEEQQAIIKNFDNQINKAKELGKSEKEIIALQKEKNKALSEFIMSTDAQKKDLYQVTQDELNRANINFKNTKQYGDLTKKIAFEEFEYNRLRSIGRIELAEQAKKNIEDYENERALLQELTEEGKTYTLAQKKFNDVRSQFNEIQEHDIILNIQLANIKRQEAIEDNERFKTIQKLRKEYDLILTNYKEQAQQLKVDTATSRGGFFSNIVKEDIKSIQTLTSTLNDLETKRNEILEVGTGRGQRGLTTQQQTELDGINTLIKANRDLLSTKVISLEEQKDFQKQFDDLNQDEIKNLMNLQFEYDKLSNVIFNFEQGRINENGKWIDDRYNNSKQFESLVRNEIKLFEKQNQIIKQNQDLSLIAYSEKISAIDTEEQRIRDLLLNETKLTVEQKAQLNAQLLDLEVEKNRVIQEQSTVNYDFEKQLSINKYNNEIELARLALEQKQMLRDEELEREQLYYDAVTGIANESANFLDAMAAHGGKSSQKFAEAALKIKKFAGVANVAISAQEEIRGIWANPALTALPDTGVTAKTALTAGAIVRAGLSTATILKQRLGGSPASSNTSPGGAPQFNIVESNGTNQLSARIGQQQNQPVQAYVVGSAVTSQQALDRNILNNSTFL